MTMQGQTGKNSGNPFFHGAFKEYPRFHRRWYTFQNLYHNSTPQRELVNLFCENCLDKKVADRLRCEETMAGCWRLLDPFYSRPAQFAQDLLAEITATKKMQFTEYEKLLHVLLQTNIMKAKKANMMGVLLTQANMGLMEQLLPAREMEIWRGRQAKYALHHHAEAFVEFVEDREEWALENIAYSTTCSGSGTTSAPSGGYKSYERRDARVMAVKASGKEEVHFPPPRGWTPDHPCGRP
jgi:hypothetical protein